MKQENESSTERPGDQPEPTTIKIQVSGIVNDQLKALAELWDQTKGYTASKLLIGSIQNHYQINKSRGRI